MAGHGRRRTCSWAAALAALACAALAPAAGAHDGAGTIESRHYDFPLLGRAEPFWALQRADGTSRKLAQPPARPPVARRAPAVRADGAPQEWPVAIVQFVLTDETGPNAPYPPYSEAAVREQMFADAATNPYSVREYYRTQTYGQINLTGLKNPDGDFFGPYSFSGIDVARGNQGCFEHEWANEALNRAIDQEGMEFAKYKSIMYLFVSGRCGYAGVGGGGPAIFINSLNNYTIIHELGHTFGNGHASTLRCYDGATPATLTSTCDPLVEYGDPFDPMGAGATFLGPNTVAHEMEPWRKIQIGAIDAADAPPANTAGTYRLIPHERASGIRMLRLPSGRSGEGKYFDLSLRRPIGVFDSTWSDPTLGNPLAFTGVLVTLDDEKSDGPRSALLDMNPDTTTFADAPLEVGKTFTDAHTGLSLKVDAISDDGADLTVAYGPAVVDVATPSIPGTPALTESGGTVSLSWTGSTDLVGVTRYIVERNGTPLPEPSGLSATDQPGPGTWSYAVRAADAAGNVSPASPPATVTIAGPPPTGTPTPTPTPTPRPLGLTLSALKTKSGRITFTLSRAAQVTLSFAQKLPGRRKGAKCVAPAKAKRGKKCTRTVKLAKSLKVAGKQGANTATPKLKAGTYTVTAAARAADGATAKRATTTLKVLKKRR